MEVAVLNSPSGLCGRKATLHDVHSSFIPYPGDVPRQRFLDEEVTGIAVFSHRPALPTGCRIIRIITPLQKRKREKEQQQQQKPSPQKQQQKTTTTKHT